MDSPLYICSLVSDSPILKTATSFDPPILNFKQGQTFANSTLKVNTQGFEFGTDEASESKPKRDHQRFQIEPSVIRRVLLLPDQQSRNQN